MYNAYKMSRRLVTLQVVVVVVVVVVDVVNPILGPASTKASKKAHGAPLGITARKQIAMC